MSGLAEASLLPFPRCEKCRELLDEGDLFCPSCGHEAPASGKNQEHEPAGRIEVHRFECPGCGASLTWELEAQGLCCAFCGRTELEEREALSIPPPRWVIPFQIDQARASALFREWLGRGFYQPRDLRRASKVTELRGVYLPYWSFSADCHFYWTADSDATPQGARAEWAPRFGEHETWYEHLLVPASGALTSYETGKLGEWDLTQAVPWAPELVRADSGPKIPGRHRNVKVNPLYTKIEAWPVLVPVWILAYTYQTRSYRFLVNGQNGKIEGSAPVSLWRLLAVAGLVLAALVLLALLSGK